MRNLLHAMQQVLALTHSSLKPRPACGLMQAQCRRICFTDTYESFGPAAPKHNCPAGWLFEDGHHEVILTGCFMTVTACCVCIYNVCKLFYYTRACVKFVCPDLCAALQSCPWLPVAFQHTVCSQPYACIMFCQSFEGLVYQ